MNSPARVIGRLAAFALLTVPAASCLKSGDSSWTGYSFVQVESAKTLKTDSGITFNVIADETNGGWAQENRLYIGYSFDGDNVTSTVYDITLTDYAPVQVKSALYKSQADSTVYGNDPVQFYGGGISGTSPGRYLNVLACYTALKSSSTVHTVDLVIDDGAADDGTIHATLTHNGSGEVFGNSSISTSDLEMVYKYLSFPLDEIVTGSESEMAVSYTFYAYSNGYITNSTTTSTVTVILK